MQWTGGKNLGFSMAKSSKLYLPVDPAPDAPNVAVEENDPNSLLNRVRKLIRLKHIEPALAAYAEFVPLYAKENTYPFVYARAGGGETLLVILNPAASAASAEFSFPVEYRELKLLAGKGIHTTKAGQTLKIEVPGQTYAIYQAVK
jgi:maltose alpha-D-glucosyltransferase/alpha-amylase